MKNKGSFALGFIVVSLLLVAVVAFFAYLYGSGNIVMKEKAKTPSPQETIEAVKTPSVEEEKLLIAEAVFTKTGLTKEEADVTVSKIQGDYATGGIKEKEAVGGAYFIAAKTEDGWVCVYDGQSTPSCDLIEPYDFPISMVSQCLSASGKVIDR